VVKDSKVLPVKAGQPIRYPVEQKSRFQPVSVTRWINDRTILSKPYAPMPDDTGAGTELEK
jgi:N-acyl-D-amino-acid deacylase